MSDQIESRTTDSPSSGSRRVLIVGGVAGGASCAARLRRLDESLEIVIFDRGPYVAFANCGLPYYVGDVIADERTLLVASPEMFRERFNIEVHTTPKSLASIARPRTIVVRDLRTGDSRTERYDALVLSPGAAPIRPPLPGSICLASSRCATFPTRAAFVPGSPIVAPAPRSSSAADLSAWRWPRI